MAHLGDKIKQARILKGYTQSDLASLIGVNVSFLCKIEKNRKTISDTKTDIICSFLDMDKELFDIYRCISKIESMMQSQSKDFRTDVYKLLLERNNNESL